MVEYELSLNSIFFSLSDPTRRDILKRISTKTLTVSEIAESYNLSLAAISKHLSVLEKAKLIIKNKKGKEHFIELKPEALEEVSEYIKYYQRFWENKLNKMEEVLSNN